jgi:hypothetical protein
MWPAWVVDNNIDQQAAKVQLTIEMMETLIY